MKPIGFAIGWRPMDSYRSRIQENCGYATAAIREFAAASDATLAAAGAAGRAWVDDTLSFDRFRDRLAAIV